MNNILYGYNLETRKKFEVSTEEICRAINSGDGFSDDYLVYTTEEDRDDHKRVYDVFEENV